MSNTEQWTILELINTTTEYFAEKGIEDPRLNAELLLSHALDMKRVELYLHSSKILSPEELDIFREYVRRRAAHEPVQYIMGKTDFYSVELIVNPAVLIPRPETEVLVDIVLKEICTDNLYPYTIVDVGTGSGAIALALADNLINAQIIATDISKEALEIARQNAVENLLENRVTFLHGKFLEPLSELNMKERVDLIVSNPPYISAKEWEHLPREIKDYEPTTALYCKDGISNHIQILRQASQYISEEGSIIFECGDHQAEKIKENVASDFDFSETKIYKDYAGKNRVILIKNKAKHF